MESGGRLLAGRYQLGRPLGAGALGQVFEAGDRAVGGRVAVKVARAQLVGDAGARGAFLRAAREAWRLSHPNVVAVLGVGEDQGLAFVATELVEGRSVRDLLRAAGPAPARRAVEIAAQVCSALGAAHAQGLVHGGLTPGDVMLRPDGRVQVKDFGLAAALGAGAPGYRSPEQVLSGRADDRSDLYALGCCLFELLTGEPLFDGPTPFVVMRRHVEERPRPASAIRPGLPAWLDDLILRTLAKHPHERPQTAAELRHALAQFQQPPARPAALSPQPPTAIRRQPAVASARTPDHVVEAAGIGAGEPHPAAPEAEAPGGARAPMAATGNADVPESVATPADHLDGTSEPVVPIDGPGAPGAAVAEGPEALGMLRVVDEDAVLTGPGVMAPPGSAPEAAAAEGLPPHEERVRELTRFAEPPRRSNRLAIATIAVGLAIVVVATVGLVAPGLVLNVEPGTASDATAATATTVAAAAPASTVPPAPAARQVPALAGLGSAEAARRLQAAGATVGRVRLVRDPKVDKGQVLGTTPQAGTALREGDAVDLVVSNGSDPVTVTELIAVIDAAPSRVGPRGRTYRARLAKLALLRGERRPLEIADLLGIARAGASNGDFTPEFSRMAVEVLSRTR